MGGPAGLPKGLQYVLRARCRSREIPSIMQRNFLKLCFSIFGYATVTTSQGALIIGGYGDSSYVATVACYNNSGWNKLDDLQSTRRHHRAIINGNKVYVIGGQGEK